MDLSGIDNDRRRAFGNIFDGLRRKFHKKKDVKLPPLTSNKKINVFNQSADCPGAVETSVSVDINTEASVQLEVGIAASGSILPTKLDSFKALVGVNAKLSAGLDLSAELSGTLNSGKINILEVPIPGFGFPGLLTVGPSFQVDAQAKATLDVVADLSVGLNYRIVDAQFEFPPNPNSSEGNFLFPQDTPLKLSASTSVKATGSVEGHIIPSLNLGLYAFGGSAEANIFLELDASAKTKLEVHAVSEVATAVLAAPTSTEKQSVARQVAALPPNASQGSAGSVPASIESSALTQPSITEAPNTTTISMIGSTSSTSTFALSPSVSSVSETSSFLPTSSSGPIFTTTGPGVTDAPSTTFEPSSSNPVSTSQVDVDSGASTPVGGCFDISA